MTHLLERDPSVILLLGDISVYAFRDAGQMWPDRVINMGACEQGSVGFAAGLAKAGYYPVFHTIASFLCRRAYEQIYVDFGLNQLAGLFVSVGADPSEYAMLGPTHHCAEDADLMERVPGMAIHTVIADLDRTLTHAVANRELSYVRLVKHAPETVRINVRYEGSRDA